MSLIFAQTAQLEPVKAWGQSLEPLDILTAHGMRHIVVEVADTDASREPSLLFRKHLADGWGMLLDFKTPQSVAFSMKNTLIPIDMFSIALDGQINSIAGQAPPLSKTPIPSGGDVLGVLEVRGGLAAELGVAPGDRVWERIFAL